MEVELYQVVWANSTSDLFEEVNEQIKSGWQPFGGVSYAVAETLGQKRDIMIQAMVQYKKDNHL